MGYSRETTDIIFLEFSFAVPNDRDAKMETSNHLKNIGEMLNDLAEYGVNVDGGDDIIQAGKDLTPRGRKKTKKGKETAPPPQDDDDTPVIELDEDEELPEGFIPDDGPEPPTLDA
jgi:hypothetical protein